MLVARHAGAASHGQVVIIGCGPRPPGAGRIPAGRRIYVRTSHSGTTGGALPASCPSREGTSATCASASDAAADHARAFVHRRYYSSASGSPGACRWASSVVSLMATAGRMLSGGRGPWPPPVAAAF